jgi:hypothetical protein
MSLMTRVPISACFAIAVFGFSQTISAQVAVPLADRARGAERVVVGRVASVTPEWQVNEFGDRLIVSRLRVTVSETLKGDQASAVDVEVEGGTIGQLTLHVSDQLQLVPGDRATFFLKRNARGAFVPYLRGQGLIRLDASDRVPGSGLTLDVIRREVAAGRSR